MTQNSCYKESCLTDDPKLPSSWTTDINLWQDWLTATLWNHQNIWFPTSFLMIYFLVYIMCLLDFIQIHTANRRQGPCHEETQSDCQGNLWHHKCWSLLPLYLWCIFFLVYNMCLLDFIQIHTPNWASNRKSATKRITSTAKEICGIIRNTVSLLLLFLWWISFKFIQQIKDRNPAIKRMKLTSKEICGIIRNIGPCSFLFINFLLTSCVYWISLWLIQQNEDYNLDTENQTDCNRNCRNQKNVCWSPSLFVLKLGRNAALERIPFRNS